MTKDLFGEGDRGEGTYEGALMDKGRQGEEIVMTWLKQSPECRNVIDMREFRISQRLDVDCGIETLDGSLVLAEIKSDSYLGVSGNILFEVFRINHYAPPDRVFYLGWAFRSPAKYLLYYSPNKHAIYRFRFDNIRRRIGKFVANGKTPGQVKQSLSVVLTDRKKTTFNILVPERYLAGVYRRFDLPEEPPHPQHRTFEEAFPHVR